MSEPPCTVYHCVSHEGHVWRLVRAEYGREGQWYWVRCRVCRVRAIYAYVNRPALRVVTLQPDRDDEIVVELDEHEEAA